ncbi:MAG: response regulator transcription factor [Deltaproteobacteria bacterium]|nr:response regulator transcription factor [Deltaproteobacteria bacterium]
MDVRILLADDHQMIREGLKVLLEREDDLEAVGEAEDGEQAVGLVDSLRPDMVIMDVVMPGVNGIEATRKIVGLQPDIKIIALSMHTEKRYVTEILKSGASGYVLKDSAFDELSRAIQVVREGKTYLSPEISGVLVEDYVRRGSSATGQPVTTPLSAREREVLQLLAEGNATKDIAEKLGVSVKTVETHRHRIMRKLGIFNVAELTKYAIREGLTDI